MENRPVNSSTLAAKLKSSNPFVGSITIPLLIVAIAVLMVAGVVKILSSDKNYITLVEEMREKSFGNRWVSAYELSKYINSSAIAPEDVPWLQNQLLDLYAISKEDPRTRHFLVLASAALRTPKSFELIDVALNDQDKDVLFGAVSGLSYLSSSQVSANFHWDRVNDLMKGADVALAQAASLVLAQHQRREFISSLLERFSTSSSELALNCTLAVALIQLGDTSTLGFVQNIFSGIQDMSVFNDQQIESIKLNFLTAFQKKLQHFGKLGEGEVNLLNQLKLTEKNILLSSRIEELLIQLKK
jgi:hypothetical protein